MAIQGRKKVKTVTIDNRSVPQGQLVKVKETKMPEMKHRKKVLSRGRVISIIDMTVFIINKRPITMIWTWLKDRLQEPSTYQGVTAIVGAIGVTLQPEMYEAIAAFMLACIGLIQTIKKEKESNSKK